MYKIVKQANVKPEDITGLLSDQTIVQHEHGNRMKRIDMRLHMQDKEVVAHFLVYDYNELSIMGTASLDAATKSFNSIKVVEPVVVD